MNWIIYALKNPRTLETRYIGWTKKSAERRLATHIRDSTSGRRTHRHRWILSLLSIGLTPVIEVLEAGSGDGWAEAEMRWIARYRAEGARLVNGTAGGQGSPGRVASPELRERISKAVRAQLTQTTPEQRCEWRARSVASRSPEQIRETMRIARESRTPEVFQRQTKTRWDRMTPEQRTSWLNRIQPSTSLELRKETLKRANASRTKEERRATSKAFQARRTPEERSASAAKAYATRRAKAPRPC